MARIRSEMYFNGPYSRANDVQAEARFKRAHTYLFSSNKYETVIHLYFNSATPMLRDVRDYSLKFRIGDPIGVDRAITGLGFEGDKFVVSSKKVCK